MSKAAAAAGGAIEKRDFTKTARTFVRILRPDRSRYEWVASTSPLALSTSRRTLSPKPGSPVSGRRPPSENRRDSGDSDAGKSEPSEAPQRRSATPEGGRPSSEKKRGVAAVSTKRPTAKSGTTARTYDIGFKARVRNSYGFLSNFYPDVADRAAVQERKSAGKKRKTASGNPRGPNPAPAHRDYLFVDDDGKRWRSSEQYYQWHMYEGRSPALAAAIYAAPTALAAKRLTSQAGYADFMLAAERDTAAGASGGGDEEGGVGGGGGGGGDGDGSGERERKQKKKRGSDQGKKNATYYKNEMKRWKAERTETSLGYMRDALAYKFSDQNPELEAALLGTGRLVLAELGRTKRDYWAHTGESMLGILLMERRSRLAAAAADKR